jgi:hypothetical protein
MHPSPPFGSSPSSSGQGPSGSTPGQWAPAGAYPPPTAPTHAYPPPAPPPSYPVGSGPQSTPPEDDEPRNDEPKKGRVDLKPTQLAGGALAAVTSAVAASKFGVTGTVMGAAFGSVVSSVASAVYQTSLTRASYRIRTIVVTPTGARGGTGTADASDPTAVPGELTGTASPVVNDTVLAPNGLPWPPEPGLGTAPSTGHSNAHPTVHPTGPSRPAPARPSRRYLKPALALGGFAFVASVGVLSLSETVLGHPISNSRDTGTSFGSVIREASGNDDESSEPASPLPSDSASESGGPSDSPTDSGTESPSASTSADSSESSSSNSDQQNQNPQGGDSSPSPDGGGGGQASPTADAGQQAASPS